MLLEHMGLNSNGGRAQLLQTSAPSLWVGPSWLPVVHSLSPGVPPDEASWPAEQTSLPCAPPEGSGHSAAALPGAVAFSLSCRPCPRVAARLLTHLLHCDQVPDLPQLLAMLEPMVRLAAWKVNLPRNCSPSVAYSSVVASSSRVSTLATMTSAVSATYIRTGLTNHDQQGMQTVNI